MQFEPNPHTHIFFYGFVFLEFDNKSENTSLHTTRVVFAEDPYKTYHSRDIVLIVLCLVYIGKQSLTSQVFVKNDVIG